MRGHNTWCFSVTSLVAFVSKSLHSKYSLKNTSFPCSTSRREEEKCSYVWTPAWLELFILLTVWEATLYTNDLSWGKVGTETDKSLEREAFSDRFLSDLPWSNYMVHLRTKPITFSNTSALYIISHKQLKNGIRCILEIIFGKELFHKSTKQLLSWKWAAQSTCFSVAYVELSI